MKIFPAVHYTMGGMWTSYKAGSYQPDAPRPEHKPGMVPPVDSEVGRGMVYGDPGNMMTNIKGLYAFGEVNFAYHGATRLGANALLSCIFDGLFCGLGVANYVRDVNQQGVSELPQSVYDAVVKQEEDKAARSSRPPARATPTMPTTGTSSARRWARR
jgi:succinate dehydrogenase / fumarate reductase flavoprotein subunit